MIDNGLSEYWFALSKDAPGKTWWNCDHEAGLATVLKVMGIAPGDLGACYAAAPFRLHISADTGRKVILAAWPAPLLFDPPSPDWLDIQAVIAWNPVKDVAHVVGDPVPQLVGALSDDACSLFASPRAFFQAWAMRRAAFAVQRQTARQRAWHVVPVERDAVPGCLMIGKPDEIRWNPAALPAELSVVGIDRASVWKAILKAAGLPSIREKAA